MLPKLQVCWAHNKSKSPIEEDNIWATCQHADMDGNWSYRHRLPLLAILWNYRQRL